MTFAWRDMLQGPLVNWDHATLSRWRTGIETRMGRWDLELGIRARMVISPVVLYHPVSPKQALSVPLTNPPAHRGRQSEWLDSRSIGLGTGNMGERGVESPSPPPYSTRRINVNKTCNRCGLDKLHSLRVYKSGKIGTQSWCVDCQKTYKDNHYRSNKDDYKQKSTERRASMRRFVQAVKSYPCTDCNLDWPYYVMQFDHLDSSLKVDDVSSIITNRGSWEKVVNEIMKCDLVCANCHFIRTHERNQGVLV